MRANVAAVVLDTAGGIQGADADTSILVGAPQVIHIDAIPAGTSVLIKGRAHPSATYVTVRTYTDADTPAIYVFTEAITQVICTRSGVGDVKVYAA